MNLHRALAGPQRAGRIVGHHLCSTVAAPGNCLPGDVSRQEQWRRSEPVRPSAEHSLGRKRDRQQLFFGMGWRGQLDADGHAGAVVPDRHRDGAEAETVDQAVLRTMRRLTRSWLSASAGRAKDPR